MNIMFVEQGVWELDIALGLHRLYTPTPNTISQTSKEANTTPVKFTYALVEVGCCGSPLVGYSTPPSRADMWAIPTRRWTKSLERWKCLNYCSSQAQAKQMLLCFRLPVDVGHTVDESSFVEIWNITITQVTYIYKYVKPDQSIAIRDH